MKWYSYIICIALIISAIFCGANLYKLVSSEGYVEGSYDVESLLVINDYSYVSNTITFYEDEDSNDNLYCFRTKTNNPSDFDGEKNQYEVLFNNQKLITAEIKPGAVYSTFDINFYDNEGNKQTATLNTYVKFYADYVSISLETHGAINKITTDAATTASAE